MRRGQRARPNWLQTRSCWTQNKLQDCVIVKTYEPHSLSRFWSLGISCSERRRRGHREGIMCTNGGIPPAGNTGNMNTGEESIPKSHSHGCGSVKASLFRIFVVRCETPFVGSLQKKKKKMVCFSKPFPCVFWNVEPSFEVSSMCATNLRLVFRSISFRPVPLSWFNTTLLRYVFLSFIFRCSCHLQNPIQLS